jgi:hypothetical protein
MSQNPIDVSLVPDEQFNILLAEIAALPPGKRAKWHGSIMGSQGTLHRVRFVNGKFGYNYLSKWIVIAPISDGQKVNALPSRNPRCEEVRRRIFNAYETGGSAAALQEHVRLIDEAATGNHCSKPHKIRVPTKAGEPVRA